MASLAVMWVVLCWLSISPVAGAVSGALSKYLFIKCQHQFIFSLFVLSVTESHFTTCLTPGICCVTGMLPFPVSNTMLIKCGKPSQDDVLWLCAAGIAFYKNEQDLLKACMIVSFITVHIHQQSSILTNNHQYISNHIKSYQYISIHIHIKSYQ